MEAVNDPETTKNINFQGYGYSQWDSNLREKALQQAYLTF